MDETKSARREACRKLRSIRGLIISYVILAVTLWAATVFMALLAFMDSQDVSLMLLFVAFIMFAMALPLSILAIAYILDYPAARRYRQHVDRVLDEK